LKDLEDAKAKYTARYNTTWQARYESCPRALKIDFFNLRKLYRQAGSNTSEDKIAAQINLFRNEGDLKNLLTLFLLKS
jgi:hypothetical protein